MLLHAKQVFEKINFSAKGLHFVLKFLALFLLWKIAFYCIWRSPNLLENYNQFSLHVIQYILIFSGHLLELAGYTVEIIANERIVRIKNTLGVSVGEPCIGYEVTAIFVGLILSSNGSWKTKAWYITFGTFVISFLNLLRIGALAILVTIDQRIWEINHKFIFTLVVYFFIFLLWNNWIKIVSKTSFNSNTPKQTAMSLKN